MNCAFCKELIDDDSVYCDQCGQEVKICPNCSKPGKSKICTSCGTRLAVNVRKADVTATETPEQTSTTGTIRLPVDLLEKKAPALTLINKNLNHEIAIEDNAVIGRNTGLYISIFSSFNQVSGKHCTFKCDTDNCWFVTDLSSTNGTMVNGQKIVPNVPFALSNGAFLKVANIEYFVKVTN